MQPNLRNALLIHNPNAGNGGSGRRRMLDEARRILSPSKMGIAFRWLCFRAAPRTF